LWAIVEISSDGIMNITGKESEFVGPTHEGLGMDKYAFGYEIVPKISDRSFKIY